MINKAMKEYMEEIHNQEQNYQKILSKTKGDGNMKITGKKILSIVAVFIVVIFVGTVSTNIYAKIQWNIEFKEYQNRPVAEVKGSIEEAKEAGYAEVLDMNYVVQNGIGAKVDSLLITDDCIDVNISFKFNEDIIVDSKSFSYGFAVYDEKEVYEVCMRSHMGEKNQKDKVTPFLLQEIKGKYNKKNIYGELLADSASLGNIEANENERTITTNFTITAKDSFPKSQKIYIRLFDLGYSMIEVDKSGNDVKLLSLEDFKVSEDEWIFEIDIPSKFYEREILELKLKDDIPGIKFTKITLSETSLVLKFESEEYISFILDGKDMPVDEFIEKTSSMLYIIDGDGEIYKETQSGNDTNSKNFKIVLNASKKDLDKKLYVNFKSNGKQYISELIKK